jgi:hypothetical protein
MFLYAVLMGHYLSNFDFEGNYLKIYTVSEKGRFGPVFIKYPQHRFVSFNYYSKKRAQELIDMLRGIYSGEFQSEILLDRDFGKFRIHFTGSSDFAKYFKARYGRKFLELARTSYFRTRFEGQELQTGTDLESCLTMQKELNTRIRDFFSKYVMQMRLGDCPVAHKDALSWLCLEQKSRENLLKKIIRAKAKIAAVSDIYEKFRSGKIQQCELGGELSALLDTGKSTNISDRVYRVLNTPENLFEARQGIDNELAEIEKANKEIDGSAKCICESNRSEVCLEEMCANLYVEKGIEV